MNQYRFFSIEPEQELLAPDLAPLREGGAPATLRPAVLVRTGLADGYGQLDSPLGPVLISYNNRGVSSVFLGDDAAAFERSFNSRFNRKAYRVAELPDGLEKAIRRRLSGEQAELEFDLRGLSSFEEAVLRKALEIPRGEVRPYAWIAKEIGQPRAVRAVGGALNHNPVPLLIPCHRVVRSDGHLGGYALGIENKHRVLQSEGLETYDLESLADKGVRYFGSDSTHIYCYPTCRHAKRVTKPHLVLFNSGKAADQAGYQPCKVCRPPAESAD